MTLVHVSDLGLLVIATFCSFLALSLALYITYRLSRIEAKLDRICDALGTEDSEDAYRQRA